MTRAFLHGVDPVSVNPLARSIVNLKVSEIGNADM